LVYYASIAHSSPSTSPHHALTSILLATLFASPILAFVLPDEVRHAHQQPHLVKAGLGDKANTNDFSFVDSVLDKVVEVVEEEGREVWERINIMVGRGAMGSTRNIRNIRSIRIILMIRMSRDMGMMRNLVMETRTRPSSESLIPIQRSRSRPTSSITGRPSPKR